MGAPKTKENNYGVTFANIIPEKKCKKCGRNFIPAPLHRYKEGSKYYCSWTCYLHRNDKVGKTNDKRTT